MSPIDPGRFGLLTFDCYGTLVDWEAGILAAARPLCAASGSSPSDAAILAAFGEAEHVVQEERYRGYREVLALTLGRMGLALGFEPSAARCDAFGASVGDWPVFPDTVDALRRLGARYRLGVVSNVDDDLFAATRTRLGTGFDWVVTARQVGSYKPATAHFEEMARRSRIPPERTLHIAQSLFHDIGPASSLGYATLHVNRRSRGGGGATPPADARADAEVADMAGVAELLLGGGVSEGRFPQGGPARGGARAERTHSPPWPLGSRPTPKGGRSMPRKRHPSIRVLLGTLVLAVGCGTESRPSGNLVYETRDSAGMDIAENSGFPAPEESWVVEADPLVSIGGVSPAPAAAFTVITQASRLSDGRIVVLENETSELRFFDENGEHLKTAGGKGEGPGEFGFAATFVRLPGDTLLVDAGFRHISFTPEGDYAGERDIDAARYFAGRLSSCGHGSLLADGSLALCEAAASEEGGRWGSRSVARLIRVAADETEVPLGLVVGLGQDLLFSTGSWTASGGSPPVVATIHHLEYSVEVRGLDGKLGRIIRRLDGRRPPTTREIEEKVEEVMSSPFKPKVPPTPPDSLPPAFGLTVGVHGDVWVRRAPVLAMRGATIFDVFDPQGRFRGQVRFDEYFWLYEVGDDYLLGARLDRWNVPHVQLHRLHRRGDAKSP